MHDGIHSLLASFEEQYENPMTREKLTKVLNGSVLLALPFVYMGYLNLPIEIQLNIFRLMWGALGIGTAALCFILSILGAKLLYQGVKG